MGHAPTTAIRGEIMFPGKCWARNFQGNHINTSINTAQAQKEGVHGLTGRAMPPMGVGGSSHDGSGMGADSAFSCMTTTGCGMGGLSGKISGNFLSSLTKNAPKPMKK